MPRRDKKRASSKDWRSDLPGASLQPLCGFTKDLILRSYIDNILNLGARKLGLHPSSQPPQSWSIVFPANMHLAAAPRNFHRCQVGSSGLKLDMEIPRITSKQATSCTLIWMFSVCSCWILSSLALNAPTGSVSAATLAKEKLEKTTSKSTSKSKPVCSPGSFGSTSFVALSFGFCKEQADTFQTLSYLTT